MMKKIFVTLLSLTILLVLLNLFFIFEKNSEEELSSSHVKSISQIPKIINSKMEVPSHPWSDSHLWNSFKKTKSYAVFSARINEKLPRFYFKISGELRHDGEFVYFHPANIAIGDLSNIILTQTLNAKDRFDNNGLGWGSLQGDMVQLIDVNFDGFLDLRLLNSTSTTGNVWYATYIYNPETQKYIFHEKLSASSGVVLDTAQKQILATWRKGYCNECIEYFTISKDNLLFLKKAEWTRQESTTKGIDCQWYTGMPTNNYIRNLCESYYKRNYENFLMFIRDEGARIIKKDI